MKTRSSSGTPVLISILLACTLLITGIIAYYAYTTTISQERAINSALENKAQYTSWSFNNVKHRSLNSRLSYFIRPVSEEIREYSQKEYTLDTSVEEVNRFIDNYECRNFSAGDDCEAYKNINVRSIFYFDPDNNLVNVTSSDDIENEKELESWLKNYIGDDERHNFMPNRIILTTRLTSKGEERLLVFTNTEQWPLVEHTLVAGYEFDIRDLEEVMEAIWTSADILPPSIDGQHPSDFSMNIHVYTNNGSTIYSSAEPPEGAIKIENAIGQRIDFLDGSISIYDDGRFDYMMGGLPSTRMTMLGVLFVLAMGLSVVAYLLFRKELAFSRHRSDFVSSVSHELRTPVTQIRLFSETLLNGRVRNKDEENRALEIIHQESRRLTNLITNVLDFSRSERNDLFINNEHIQVDEVVRESIEAFTPIARSGKSSIQSEIEPISAYTDPEAIRQILINLLDNAVKYGSREQTIRVYLWKDTASFHLRVEDEGDGIPAEIRDKIWEPFWRHHPDEKTDSRPGSGIGLSVVKQYILMLHGDIRVENNSGGGAGFEITLPLSVTSGADEADYMHHRSSTANSTQERSLY